MKNNDDMKTLEQELLRLNEEIYSCENRQATLKTRLASLKHSIKSELTEIDETLYSLNKERESKEIQLWIERGKLGLNKSVYAIDDVPDVLQRELSDLIRSKYFENDRRRYLKMPLIDVEWNKLVETAKNEWRSKYNFSENIDWNKD